MMALGSVGDGSRLVEVYVGGSSGSNNIRLESLPLIPCGEEKP